MESGDPELSEEFFFSLERSELRRRCKEHGIKANLATKDMARILFNLQKGVKTPMRFLKAPPGALRPSTSARKSEARGSSRRLSGQVEEQGEDARDAEMGRRRLQLSPVRGENSPEENQDQGRGNSVEEEASVQPEGAAQECSSAREKLPSVERRELNGDGAREDPTQPGVPAALGGDPAASFTEKPAAVLKAVCPDSNAAGSATLSQEGQVESLNSSEMTPHALPADTGAAEGAAAINREQSCVRCANADVGGSRSSPLVEECPFPSKDRSDEVDPAAQCAVASEPGCVAAKQREDELAKVVSSTVEAEATGTGHAGTCEMPEGSEVAQQVVPGANLEATQQLVAQDSQPQAIASKSALAPPPKLPSASPTPSAVHAAVFATPATPADPHLHATEGSAAHLVAHVFGSVRSAESLVGKMLEAERRDEEERSKPLTAGRTPLKSLMLANQDHMRKERMKAREDHARKLREAQIQAARGLANPARSASPADGVGTHGDAAEGAGGKCTASAVQGQP